MVNHEGLIRHLTVCGNGPFGLLSQQALPTDGILYNAFGTRLAALFSAEHGWFGLAGPGEKTGGDMHPFWHIPVHSLYGETRRPTPEMLQGLERIVIDLQDIGVRCYTYMATIKNMLEAAAEAHLPVTVLDRPVPLGGILDGPMRELSFSSFVAPLNVPLCHGMTPGEYARYIVRAESLDLDLSVIKMKDWGHHVRNPWTNFTPPSPGIRSWDSAALYPATLFTEAYPALDCDRGGPLSFRILGAPWLDAAAALDALADVLPACGMGARPYRYKSSTGQYAGQSLDGMLLSVENPDAFYPVTGGVIIFAALIQRHPDALLANARPEWFDKLFGTSSVRGALRRDALSELFQGWIDAQDAYLAEKVDLYI